MSAMKRLFQVMADKKASDIFLTVGAPINIKINGVAMPVNQTVLNADAVRTLLYEVLTEPPCRRRTWRGWSATAGRATCASCAT